MSGLSVRNRIKKSAKSSKEAKKKSRIVPGELMVSKHPGNQNIAKKLLRKLTHIYANHRAALIFVIILLLGSGGYVIYRSFAATGVNRDPTAQEVYDYVKARTSEYGGITLGEGSKEVIRLPHVACFNKAVGDGHNCGGEDYQDYVLYVNPSVDLGGNILNPRDYNSARCFIPYTEIGARNRIKTTSYITIANKLGGWSLNDGPFPGTQVGGDVEIKLIEKVFQYLKIITSGEARINEGEYIDCGREGELGVAAYKAAYNRIRHNLSMYGHPHDPPKRDLLASVPELSFGSDLLCYSLYPAGTTLEKCRRNPEVYTNLPPSPPATPVTPMFAVPAQEFNNYRQQLVQIALGKGASVEYLKAMCNTYTDPTGCKLFIDQSCDYFRFCGNPPPGPVATPVKSAPKPPPKDPRRGEDDGRWQQWPFNKNFYANPALPGRCIYKKANGTFAVGVNGADYDCNHLSQMYKCQAEMAKLNPKDPSSFSRANISPECGDQSKLRAAGKYVEWVLLNETPPKGNLEEKSADCTVQTGWAYSEINKSATLGVDLYYDGPAGTGQGYPIKADVQRDDLKGFGNNGIHGFSFDIPDKYKDNNFHTVYMYARGVQVNGFPNNKNPLVGQRTFQCDYPPTGNLEKVDAKMVNGKFTCKAQGWAFDRSNPNQPIQVHAYIDGIPGRSTGSAINLAALYRDDLKNAGQGNGKHGFYFDIPEPFRDANKHTLRVYALGINNFWNQNGMNPLIGTIDFQCDQPPDGKLEIATRRLKPADALSVECVVGGWTADKSNVFYDNKVTLYFDLSADFKTYSSKVDSMKTGIDRPDVRAAGWGWGNAGNHGFLYQIPKQYWDGKNHTVHAYSMNTDINGVYIKQNNTFIGSKSFNCAK